MAAALMAISIAPGVDHMFQHFGDKRARQRQVKRPKLVLALELRGHLLRGTPPKNPNPLGSVCELSA